MVPYFELHVLRIGPITLEVWGLLVSVGILITLFIAWKLLARQGIAPEPLAALAVWAVLSAFFFARIFYALFYEPRMFALDPLEFFRVWHGGFSSFGGFFGGAVAGVVYIRKKRLPEFAYIGATLTALPWGWAIGRIGCFLIHDHPGRLTNSFLGVKYPDGTRFDLGLIEILVAVSAGVLTVVLKRFFKKEAIAPMAGAAWYAVARFFIDFLRANDLPGSDARYLGLTPAQYGSIIMFAAIIIWVVKRTKNKF